MSDASGKLEAYVDTFPTPTHARRVPVDGAALDLFFRSDGRELLLLAAASESSAVFACDLRLGDELEIGRPRKLFDLPAEAIGLAPTPSGDRFLVLLPVGSRAPAHFVA